MRVRCKCNHLVEMDLLPKRKIMPEDIIEDFYHKECPNCERIIQIVIHKKVKENIK